ncbi:(2Fe-2S)-binding protein [Streptomyces viridochromogenes]|uniref:Putative 2Fe-2S iron-sulfur cluster binding domain-containing protein n=1 Tax=Streptomyces viridochromogenes Tue57 TaxID=1160705 RepID=L8P4L0_STRVR|nr:(2Fe-2S)-binding protein [Streptomyces viridochromogenes]ELS51058.1 putative 2Fe-2S iron-sulfur cluster binding domain-containing protein [Streptomyces viridochromogenes Tue57]
MPEVSITVNGVSHRIDVDVRLLLVEALREVLGLAGPKVGCRTGDCGACTVSVDGRAKKSCLSLAVAADGSDVTTLDGLADGDEPHPLQRAFCEEYAFQCGYCLSGMLFAARELLAVTPDPSDDEIGVALRGNLCRCTGYQNIVRAVRSAARAMAPSAAPADRASSSGDRGVLR